MKEQSHKEEMSAALRGDFQRLRERGVPATLVPTASPASESPSEVAAEPEPVAQAPAPVRPPVETEPRVDEVTDDDVPSAPAGETPEIPPPADAPAERRGWLARLVGR